MPDLRPANPLETVIRLGKRGEASPDDVMAALASSDVVVLTPADAVPTPEHLDPLVVHRGDLTFVAVFTDVDQVPPEFGASRTGVIIPAATLLRGISPEAGIVVNAGTSDGFEVPAAGLSAFRAQLVETPRPLVDRYFVRQHVQDGALVPYALLRRRFGADGQPIDEVLRGVDTWGSDRRGGVDRAVRFPIDSDLDEVTAAQADQVQRMVADGNYRPLSAT